MIAEGGSYIGGSEGMLPRKVFKNKAQNTAIWGYLGGFGYIENPLSLGQF